MNALARFNQWSRKYPNARLAALGLILIYIPVGAAKGFEVATIKLFDFLYEGPDGGVYYRLAAIPTVIVMFLLCIPIFVGTVMIPFAAYRAIRDYFARRRALINR